MIAKNVQHIKIVQNDIQSDITLPDDLTEVPIIPNNGIEEAVINTDDLTDEEILDLLEEAKEQHDKIIKQKEDTVETI